MATVPQTLPATQALRAVIYNRVSTLRQRQQGYSPGAQSADCRKLAEEIGATVVAEYEDTDSGAEWELPGLNAMLDAAKRREFNVLLVYDIDRLARNRAKQLVLEEELERSGVSIRYVTLPHGDTAEDRLLKNIRADIAEYEREKIVFRTMRGSRAKAETGRFVGNGSPPFGYRKVRDARGKVTGLQPDPETYPIVERIFRDATRLSLLELRRQLIDERIPCPRFSGEQRPDNLNDADAKVFAWSDVMLGKIIRNPVYSGTAYYGRQNAKSRKLHDPSRWIAIPVPALVATEVQEAACAALDRRKATHAAQSPETDADFPMRGVLTCANCGGVLACTRATSKGVQFRYYTCLRRFPNMAERQGRPLCGLAAIPARQLEEYTWDTVLAALLNEEQLNKGLADSEQEHAAATARRGERVAILDREMNRQRRQLGVAVDYLADAEPGSETAASWKQKIAEIEKTMRRLTVERNELTALPAPGLSPEQSQTIRDFAANVRYGFEHGEWSNADKQRVIRLLQLRASVRHADKPAPDGDHWQRLGRYFFNLSWSAVIPIPFSSLRDDSNISLHAVVQK